MDPITITVDGVSCEISDFNLTHALAGGTLIAQDLEEETPTYYSVTEFQLSKTNYAVEFGYQAKIQNQAWTFNEFGEELHEKYKLYTGRATITGHGAGNEFADGTIGDPNTQYFSLTSLNYRESVAIQVLNAMIYHIPDPISYDEASIRLLVKKAFTVSEEFLSQALTIRKTNASYDGTDIVADESTTEGILNNISTSIDKIKSAFMTEPVYDGQTVVTPGKSVLNEIEAIKTQQQNIATALAGTGGTGIAAQIGQIVTNTASVRDALIDTSDPNNPVNRIDNMATIVASQGSDIEDIKTYTNQINSALYTDTTDSSSSTIRTAGKSLWEIEKCQDDIKRSLKFDGISYDGNRVVDNVISINGKLGGN